MLSWQQLKTLSSTAPNKLRRLLRPLRNDRNLLHSLLRTTSCLCVHARRSLSSTSSCNKDTYFITTPIFYVNAAPHVGHLYCSLLADASSRWQKVKGENTFFSTGTDEHGLKIQQAARTAGVAEEQFCDGVSQKFKAMFDTADIQYDRFIRTTEPCHQEAVHAFWRTLCDRDHIYKGKYAGWYSVSDEAFLGEDEVTETILPSGDKVMTSLTSGHRVTWTEETNYKFRLSSFQGDLLYWLKSHPIQPIQFEKDVRAMIQNLPDLSVSRDSGRLTWGIPVPGDTSQTIYVWLDALINYLTVTGYPSRHDHNAMWPPACQIIGKDILRFHAVYWPAFLMAAGLEPPPRLLCHSHWLVDHVKMSKSLGNVVEPMDRMSQYGVDAFRYFLLKEGALDSDGSYSDKRVVERVNSDLANTLGNLLGRCTAPSVNKEQQFPPCPGDDLMEFLTCDERDSLKALYDLPEQVDRLYEAFQFPKGLDSIMHHLHWANALVQAHAPWQLAKSVDSRDHAHLTCVLHVAMETLRVCGILLQPVVPSLSHRLLSRLGVPLLDRGLAQSVTPLKEGYPQLGEKIVLQRKIKLDSSS